VSKEADVCSHKSRIVQEARIKAMQRRMEANIPPSPPLYIPPMASVRRYSRFEEGYGAAEDFNAGLRLQLLDYPIHVRGTEAENISECCLRQREIKSPIRSQSYSLKSLVCFQEEVLDTIRGAEVACPKALADQMLNSQRRVRAVLFRGQADWR